MPTILDYSKHLLELGKFRHYAGDIWKGPCPLCGGTDRFSIHANENHYIGQICAAHNITGRWFCNQCNPNGGDTLDWFIQIEGLTFKEALAELGIQSDPAYFASIRRAPSESLEASFTPSPRRTAQENWIAHVKKLVKAAENQIWNHPNALAWLAKRGIPPAAIRQYHLGCIAAENPKYSGIFRSRESFCLPEKFTENGKPKHLFIPRGITIPSFDQYGNPVSLRIRRPNPDTDNGNFPKYMQLEGSANITFFLPSTLPKDSAIYFIVEAELDAILIHFVSAGLAGAVALSTNMAKPDPRVHKILQAAAQLCIALDNDPAGENGVPFWLKTYNYSAIRTPSVAKDPGDDFATLGLDAFRKWIEKASGLELPPPAPETYPEKNATLATQAQKNENTAIHQNQPQNTPTPAKQPQTPNSNGNTPPQIRTTILSTTSGWQCIEILPSQKNPNSAWTLEILVPNANNDPTWNTFNWNSCPDLFAHISRENSQNFQNMLKIVRKTPFLAGIQLDKIPIILITKIYNLAIAHTKIKPLAFPSQNSVRISYSCTGIQYDVTKEQAEDAYYSVLPVNSFSAFFDCILHIWIARYFLQHKGA